MMTLGRKKTTVKDFYYKLKAGKISFHKMPHEEPFHSVDVPCVALLSHSDHLGCCPTVLLGIQAYLLIVHWNCSTG
jgi:hypothetical protein